MTLISSCSSKAYEPVPQIYGGEDYDTKVEDGPKIWHFALPNSNWETKEVEGNFYIGIADLGLIGDGYGRRRIKFKIVENQISGEFFYFNKETKKFEIRKLVYQKADEIVKETIPNASKEKRNALVSTLKHTFSQTHRIALGLGGLLETHAL